MALRLHNKRWFPLIFLAALAAATAAWFYFTAGHRPEFLVSAIGAAAGLTYFLYRQRLDETKFFKELFVLFNERYDQLNDGLNDILFGTGEGKFEPAQRELMFSYFNLCAEEYLFYRAGYIDRHVWNSWYSGMKVFFDHPRIRALWDEDCKANSYYGFQPPKRYWQRTAPSHARKQIASTTPSPTWQGSPRQTTSAQNAFSVRSHFSFAPQASTDWAQQFVDACLSYESVRAFVNEGGIGFDPNFVFIERVYTEEEGFAASFYGTPDEFAKYGHQLQPGRSNSYSRLRVKSSSVLEQALKCVHISANLKGLKRT
jgi:hypothetical protein